MRSSTLPCAVQRALLGCALCGALTVSCRFDSRGLPGRDTGTDLVSLWDTALLDLAGDLDPRDQRLDAPPSDGEPVADLPVTDAPGCASILDPQTVMLLQLDQVTGFTFKDVAGMHDGTVSVKPQLVAGPTGCGKALHVPLAGSGGVYVEVPDALDFQLPQGSLDAWVRFDAQTKGNPQGIMSRDALGTNESGHLSLFRACDGSVVVRLQDQGNNYHRCSTPVSDSGWIHVGVNFGGIGGLSLFINGQPATGTQSIQYGSGCGIPATCGGSTTAGISGNTNPWVIGADTMNSKDGLAQPTSNHLGGTIDEVRISKIQRTF